MPIIANRLKQKILAGEPAFVFNVRLSRTADILSLAVATGHDGFYIDLQHGALTVETVAQICTAALHTPVTAYVRTPSVDAGLIGVLLDAGAQGIMAPDIRTAEEARRLVRAALLPPAGERATGGCFPDPRFSGVDPASRREAINRSTLLVAMLESEAAIDAAAEIGAVEGIDALQIGTTDLSESLGVPGQPGHERVRAAYRRAIEACRAIGKPLIAGGIRQRELFEAYVRMGAARCYFTGIDAGFMLEGGRAAIATAKAADAAAFG